MCHVSFFHLLIVFRRMYCSPSGIDMYKKHKTCFTKSALVRLAEAWNTSHPTNKIRSYKQKSKQSLWDELNTKMSDTCGKNNVAKEACWADNLYGARPHAEVAKRLRPLKPKEWSENEYTWLTNYDIEAVMKQYDWDTNKSYKYKFIGVFPIDFQARTAIGQCLFEEFCSLNIVSMYKKGIRYLGFITNLDKHNEPGSHWTSMFICIDPKLPAFGAYYYDSVAAVPPKEISVFVDTIKKQVATFSKGAEFKVKYNNMRHQRGSSECGVFSIDYQIRWIESLLRKRKTSFEDVTQMAKLNDNYIHKFRDVYFRPNQKRVKAQMHH